MSTWWIRTEQRLTLWPDTSYGCGHRTRELSRLSSLSLRHSLQYCKEHSIGLALLAPLWTTGKVLRNSKRTQRYATRTLWREQANISMQVECFLLHGKAQSSGLTLINATHVFLCEPLINTAIELQAIARVHRIGQHRPTTVWMYLVSGTVEESIYELSVTRRMAHIIEKEKRRDAPEAPVDGSDPTVKDLTETAIDSANSMELQDSRLGDLMQNGAAGGEMVKKDDLWQCLFGNIQKDGHDRSTEAEREVGRFLRGDAAEQRADQR